MSGKLTDEEVDKLWEEFDPKTDSIIDFYKNIRQGSRKRINLLETYMPTP